MNIITTILKNCPKETWKPFKICALGLIWAIGAVLFVVLVNTLPFLKVISTSQTFGFYFYLSLVGSLLLIFSIGIIVGFINIISGIRHKAVTKVIMSILGVCLNALMPAALLTFFSIVAMFSRLK